MIDTLHHGRRRPPTRTLATLLALSLGLTACRSDEPTTGDPSGKALATATDTYYHGVAGAAVKLAFQADRVGVLTHERAGRRQVGAIAKDFGLEIELELSGGMFILAGRQLPTRKDALELARALRARSPQIIRDAGFVVIAEGEQAPSMIGDELLVRFPDGTSDEEIKRHLDEQSLDVVRRGKTGTFRLRVTDRSPGDAVDLARYFAEDAKARAAEPNRHALTDRDEVVPGDPLFASQWHLRNGGASGGTVDADVDASLAWDITVGNPSVIIAVVDNTFDIAHEDLAPNLYTTPGEIAGNFLDDDGNGYIDDVNGWDFVSGDNDPRPVSAGDNHGTAVAGVALARQNGLGVSGACPTCRFIPLTVLNNCATGGGGCVSSAAAKSEAIEYAAFSDAQIITSSWGDIPGSAIVNVAVDDATAQGKLVLFSAGNAPTTTRCMNSYVSLPNVLAVSSSSNLDRRVNGHGRGACVDVLAPTRFGGADTPGPTGTLAIPTSDRTGGAGYNTTDPACVGGLVEPGNTRYTNCFSGTSSATPLVAGIAGLVLSANGSLGRVDVQRLLQDTTDKIEDSLGVYDDSSGFGTATDNSHAFGRVNAYEAAAVAAGTRDRRAGVDVFLRDNRLDWGNTEQPSNVTFEPTRGHIGHWQSVDIKIDAPPYQGTPMDAAGFAALVDERAKEGELNKVYVRVRNRGPVTALDVDVKLHYAQFGTALPTLPVDFWAVFPADSATTSDWHPLGLSAVPVLPYSGASVAGCPGRAAPACGGDVDTAVIVAFDWVGPSVAPGTPNHFCLFAVVDSPDDRVSAASRALLVPDAITPTDNNVTHRNVQVEEAGDGDAEGMFYVRNPYDRRRRTVVDLRVPEGWFVKVDGIDPGKPFDLDKLEQRIVKFRVERPSPEIGGSVEFVQRFDDDNKSVSGGAVIEFPGKRP
jgi:subtilisin family serine protease